MPLDCPAQGLEEALYRCLGVFSIVEECYRQQELDSRQVNVPNFLHVCLQDLNTRPDCTLHMVSLPHGLPAGGALCCPA